MDNTGHWHDRDRDRDERFSAELRRSLEGEGRRDAPPMRPVIEIEVGERVCVVNAAGEKLWGSFRSANKNKVTIAPCSEGQPGPAPYFELAEHVHWSAARAKASARKSGTTAAVRSSCARCRCD